MHFDTNAVGIMDPRKFPTFCQSVPQCSKISDGIQEKSTYNPLSELQGRHDRNRLKREEIILLIRQNDVSHARLIYQIIRINAHDLFLPAPSGLPGDELLIADAS